MQSLRPESTSASVLDRSRTGESKSSVRNCLHSTGRAARSGSLCAPKGHVQKHPWCKWADMQGAEGQLAIAGAQTLARTRFMYCEYSNEELYEGEPTLERLLELMPTFEIVHRLPDDVLLRNTSFAG